MSTIYLSNIIKVYNPGCENELKALNVDELTIRDGEFISIMGSSGAGKSTLMYIIGCLDNPSMGIYSLDRNAVMFSNGRSVAALRNKMFGFVFQEFGLIPQQTVLENVEIPLLFSKTGFRQRKKRCLAILEKLNIRHLSNKKCSQLSGGQKQRVAIARALVNDPDVLLADEPTGALDSNTAKDILGIFQELNIQGKTVIIVTHNPLVAEICNRHIIITDGVIIADEYE